MTKMPSFLPVVCALMLLCADSKAATSSKSSSSCSPPTTIGFHAAVCSPDGNLALPLAFSSLQDSLLRAVSWYQRSPLNEHGFPPVVRIHPSCSVTPAFSRQSQPPQPRRRFTPRLSTAASRAAVLLLTPPCKTAWAFSPTSSSTSGPTPPSTSALRDISPHTSSRCRPHHAASPSQFLTEFIASLLIA